MGALLACCGGFVYSDVVLVAIVILHCNVASSNQFWNGFMLLVLNVLQASTHNSGTRLPPFWRTRIRALLRQVIATEQVTGLYTCM